MSVDASIEIGAGDIDSMLEQAIGKIGIEQQDLSLQNPLDPDFDAATKANSVLLAKMQAKVQQDAQRDMLASKRFARDNLMAGDGTNAKAPSRIRNRILSRVR